MNVTSINHFDITEAGSITGATVSLNIQHGDPFNIYYGDADNSRKQSSSWKGHKTTKETLQADLEKSIQESAVFLGESINSEDFYNAALKSHCDCTCSKPVIRNANEKKVIAVDLDSPEYDRSSGRYIVFSCWCESCDKKLIHGTTLGCFRVPSLNGLKERAQLKSEKLIDWPNVITSLEGLVNAQKGNA